MRITGLINVHGTFRVIFVFFTFKCLLVGMLFWTAQSLFCQKGGYKYTRNYHYNEYEGHAQNWSVLQDKRGLIYVANNAGLLEFDGVSWRSVSIPNSLVRSMTADDDGTIYIGGNDELGFLAPDSKRALEYVSLGDYLEDDKKNFSRVWRTHSTKKGIYFRASKFLFRWNPDSKQMNVWTPAYDFFYGSFVCNGKLFINQDEIGLTRMVDDSLKPVPGGEIFAKIGISMIVPYNIGRLLIGTANGFYLFDGKKMNPFSTGVDDYLEKKELYHGIRLTVSPGDFALATLRGGLVIMDSKGNLKKIFNKASGLMDDNVKYVFEDSRGNLWLALNKGISRIEYASPLSLYDDRSNLPGLVRSVVKHRGVLYAGTSSGLYFLTSTDKFRPVPGMTDDCYSILSAGASLLAATSKGVFQVDVTDENKVNGKREVIENRSTVLLQSRINPNRTWVGTRRGLLSLYLDPENRTGRWAKETIFKEIDQEIMTIVEEEKGNLWLGTRAEGVLKVDFPGDVKTVLPRVISYGTSHGLPPGEVHVFMAVGHVMFATPEGIFRFDEKKKNFIPDSTLGEEFADGSRGVFRIAEDKNKNIWFHSMKRNFHAVPQADGSFKLDKKTFLRVPPAQVNAIYPDPGADITWFAGHEGIIRFDSTLEKKQHHEFSTFIRKVWINGELHFDGYGVKPGSRFKTKNFFPIEHKDRNLRFEFAAPFFEDESSTQYQCFLEGYDSNWSGWDKVTKKDYTNLDSGRYTFRVRAQNVYENLSREDFFQFKILPPWYKIWWAFLLYAFAVFLALFFIVKWRSGKLEREKQKLEQIVKERTKEINRKNKQLKEQSEKLQEMDKMKSRFFANISHEFRTPLTLIMGPLEQILSTTRGKDQKKQLDLMLRNSQRLLTLINQLLDLSKFDSGKMRLQACSQDVIPFLKGILASFESMADQHELKLQFLSKKEKITLYFDTEKLEEVICNLLLNAARYTPAGGGITLSVDVKERFPDTKDRDFPSGYVEISVGDTGAGIPKEQLIHIFERFYQAESTAIQECGHKGTGIGLAIAKEMVDIHHGKIDVHSRTGENSGTEFIIRLPLGKDHLKPQEIIDPSQVPSVTGKSGKISALYKIKETAGGSESGSGWESGIDAESGAREKNLILLVEDSADVRVYIKGALEPTYGVVEAANGEQGIQMAKKIIPDLIISDIMMPGVDGYELCSALKNDLNTSHIPVILLTAKASAENIIRGLESGADDYITKPFNTKMLCTRIKNLIDLRRQLQLKIQRQKNLLPAEISVSSIDESFLKELQDIIEENLSNPDFKIEQMCKKLYLGRTTLFRKIEALTGETPNQFIQSYRLERAAQLLKANFGNVTDVAFEVGFSSSAYFTKCFKEKFHQTPTTFQASEAG